MSEKTKVTCRWCGASLPITHTGRCPACGQQGKTIVKVIDETIGLRESLNWQKRREFFETNPKIKRLTLGITVCSLLLGLLLSLIFPGWLGAVLGLIVGIPCAIVSWLLGPHAITRVREIVHGSS